MADEQQAEQPLSPVVEAPPPSGPRSLADAEASAKAAIAKAMAAKPTNDNAAPAVAPAANDNAAGAPAAEEQKPAEVEPAEELAKYIREARRLREEQRRFEAERAKHADDRKAFEAEAASLRAAKELVAKGDRLGAIKALFGDGATDDVFWELVQGYKAEQLTPDQIAQRATKAALEKLDADRKAAAQEQQRFVDETVTSARSQYVEALATAYRADVAKYPMLRANPISADAMMEFVDSAYRATGAVPDPAMVLDRAEANLREQAKKFAQAYRSVDGAFFSSLAAPPAPAAPPVRTITSALQRDSRGAVPSDGRRMSYAEREEATKRAIADALRNR